MRHHAVFAPSSAVHSCIHRCLYVHASQSRNIVTRWGVWYWGRAFVLISAGLALAVGFEHQQFAVYFWGALWGRCWRETGLELVELERHVVFWLCLFRNYPRVGVGPPLGCFPAASRHSDSVLAVSVAVG
ncbi:hypothetical protein GQ54DRAFT_8061 [Martensiomyces pterosporus]|nr:hypothetical protein GQ54DRAFT_8061 [Martensiomyces pterosporus]